MIIVSSRNRIFVLLFSLAVIFCFTEVRAQQSMGEFSASVGHLFGGSYSIYSGEIGVEDAMDYVAALDFPANRDVSLELSYTYAVSYTKYYAYPYYQDIPGQPTYDSDVHINYILIGALHEVKGKGKVTPFGGASLGAVVFDFSDPHYSSVWHAALGFQLGLKVDVSEKIGLRLGGRFLLPLYFYGVSIYAGTGGSGAGVSGGIPIVQGDLTAGLTIKM